MGKWVRTGLMAVLLGAAGPAQADLPLLDGNLQVPNMGVPRYESSADILLQLPVLVDPESPVPLGIRVFQDGVRSIRLLSDELKPQSLANFYLEPGTRPELSTRFRAAGNGVLVVVRTADRVLSARRSYTLDGKVIAPQASGRVESTAQDGKPAEVQASAAVPSVAASVAVASVVEAKTPVLSRLDDMELRAWRGAAGTVVEFRSTASLSKHIHNGTLNQVSTPVIERFEILHGKTRLLRAELSEALWFEPYFRFSFTGGKADDELVLNWWAADGNKGKLVTSLSDLD
ncbi:hypothetical protein ADIMK_2960 [Marinobacterium lacunae]|uniref:Uncharacterized protein n=1 Tax=Marinobacterium lacunae TaxID=1232683 RepID=A0A081FWE6_9GAMM|nr:thiosulfate oxidation carrier complex protein SoxZ [Marinobacterium lacunae]KEA62851.1 hypothetical protein ADIMK_2960 [Marinobacterium lacunae]